MSQADVRNVTYLALAHDTIGVGVVEQRLGTVDEVREKIARWLYAYEFPDSNEGSGAGWARESSGTKTTFRSLASDLFVDGLGIKP